MATSPPFNVEKAKEAQNRLARITEDAVCSQIEPTTVAGADVAYKGEMAAVAATILTYPSLRLLEKAGTIIHRRIPYRPGFLGFSEGPLIYQTVRKLSQRPDLLLVDGHGRAHPRRFGLACHVGIILDIPTVGVAKRLLTGNVVNNRIVDDKGQIIGQLFNREGMRTLYVSVGYKITLHDAIKIIRTCTIDGLPEPIKTAHQEATRIRGSMEY